MVFPILAWLLQRVPELQKRAYLAKFLVKIDVPAEIMGDEEVNGIYIQVCTLVYYSLSNKYLQQKKNYCPLADV